MDKKIMVAVLLAFCAALVGIASARINSSTIILIPLGLIGASLVFFSRGILIFLTILCLSGAGIQFFGIGKIALQLRWVLFGIFCLHVFGDIFLGRTVRRIKLFDALALVFIAYAFMSMSYSLSPLLTLERSTTILLLYIVVFWVIWKYAYEQGPEKVIHIILNAMRVVFLLGLSLIFLSPIKPFMGNRFFGLMGNPNGLGVLSALVLPISLWQFLETRKNSALFLFFAILVSLLLAGARGPINATIFGLGYFIYIRSKKHTPAVFFSWVSFILVFIWLIETSAKQLFKAYARVESLAILGGRMEAWKVAINLFLEKPIFGYGFGVEDKIFASKKVVFHVHSGEYVHNSFLGISVQLGLLGFVIFFLPLFLLLFKELFYRQEPRAVPLLRYALRASLIAGLFCCMSESWIYSVGSGVVLPFWIMVMLLVFYCYRDGEEVA